jgi:formamidopyrimidine-DNA glycosylase
MPELPEVETIRRGLEPRLTGQVIRRVEVRHPKSFIGVEKNLVGRRIDSIERQGKLLIFFLDDETAITVHLKMTGQLIWQADLGEESVMGGHPAQSYMDPLPHKHTRVILEFEDDSTLYFNDLRIFGRVTHLTQAELEQLEFLITLGPEPLSKEFDVAYLTEAIKAHPKLAIKIFLLDQQNIAGLGNIYADESLFRAAIMPTRQASDLSQGEIRNLHEAIQETLELALMYGGSSEKDYVNAIGDKGTYLRIANVYHRTGQDCNRCAEGVIERIKLGGRSTHFCPVCQR